MQSGYTKALPRYGSFKLSAKDSVSLRGYGFTAQFLLRQTQAQLKAFACQIVGKSRTTLNMSKGNATLSDHIACAPFLNVYICAWFQS